MIMANLGFVLFRMKEGRIFEPHKLIEMGLSSLLWEVVKE